MLVALVAVALFNWGASSMTNEVLAMKYVILFYSFVNIAMGLFALFAVKDEKMRLFPGNAEHRAERDRCP